MLLEGMRARYATIKEEMISDGFGGWISGGTVTDVEFDAAISTDLSTEAMIGGAVAGRQNYTLAVPLDIHLELGQIFVRLQDGQYFRVTSTPSDKKPPSYSIFSDYQITAEAALKPE